MKLYIFISVLLVTLSANVYPENRPSETPTPYGERCPMCGAYGYCSKQPTHKEAVNVLQSHYAKKGMQVVIIKQDGRFIEAEVTKNNKIIDRVLLDCRTGRIRSIY